jgi:hypothetical protein
VSNSLKIHVLDGTKDIKTKITSFFAYVLCVILNSYASTISKNSSQQADIYQQQKANDSAIIVALVKGVYSINKLCRDPFRWLAPALKYIVYLDPGLALTDLPNIREYLTKLGINSSNTIYTDNHFNHNCTPHFIEKFLCQETPTKRIKNFYEKASKPIKIGLDWIN